MTPRAPVGTKKGGYYREIDVEIEMMKRTRRAARIIVIAILPRCFDCCGMIQGVSLYLEKTLHRCMRPSWISSQDPSAVLLSCDNAYC